MSMEVANKNFDVWIYRIFVSVNITFSMFLE